ncbi:MAG TPA: radical SAM family heme chaperone HemW [Alphaproteobacteria bacterium]|nr:coproporphyrinogen III oxidase [Alphaproteobacteria bacterium]HOO50139.1 radical SAM family heme chaperone HemW [Alphaproteobacteria bacterium]
MSFGIYIHWPFCKSKCPYCDFNSHVSQSIDIELWRAAYLKSLAYGAGKTPDRIVESVFFGGGTPSLMPPDLVADILAAIQRHWRVANDWEVTLEANPTSFEIEKFEAFRAAGVNRVSIGVQSLYEGDLKFLGREHSPDQARFAISEAQKIFDRTSFDLIYARPNQTVEAWRRELDEALSLSKGHLSLYQLTIEKGTPFFTRHARKEFTIPEQDLAADLYDVTQEVLEQAGMPAYEVSNHAVLGQESRHNLIYWQYGEYLGIGPGAHGRVVLDGQRYSTRDHRAPDIWLERVSQTSNGLQGQEALTLEAQFQECLMMGMRLRDGVPVSRLEPFCGGNVFSLLDRKSYDHLVTGGVMEDMSFMQEKTLRTTPQGFKCLNAVLGYLLS